MCDWCRQKLRFECYLIDDNGHTVSIENNIVQTIIAKYCPMCGTYLGEDKPLTLKQLEKLDGQPVYCVDNKGNGKWALVYAYEEKCTDSDYGDWEFYEYGMKCDTGWLAYKHKPRKVSK